MKIQNIKLFAATVAAIGLAVTSSHANLIVNGGFETGTAFLPVSDVTGWSGTFQSSITTTDQNTLLQAAQLGPNLGSISQTIAPPLTAGTYYVLSFWAKDDGNVLGLSQTLSATVFNGLSASFDTTTTYTLYNYTFQYLLGPSLLSFGWSDGNNSAFIDDVSLVAVPEPTTVIAGALLLLPFGASALRILRKNRETAV